jgi:hypothetical protein
MLARRDAQLDRVTVAQSANFVAVKDDLEGTCSKRPGARQAFDPHRSFARGCRNLSEDALILGVSGS